MRGDSTSTSTEAHAIATTSKLASPSIQPQRATLAQAASAPAAVPAGARGRSDQELIAAMLSRTVALANMGTTRSARRGLSSPFAARCRERTQSVVLRRAMNQKSPLVLAIASASADCFSA